VLLPPQFRTANTSDDRKHNSSRRLSKRIFIGLIPRLNVKSAELDEAAAYKRWPMAPTKFVTRVKNRGIKRATLKRPSFGGTSDERS
jgi:hypothetical protein